MPRGILNAIGRQALAAFPNDVPVVLSEGHAFEIGFDRRSLGQDQSGASDGAASKMNEVPVVREAVETRILAHRRNDDAIAKGDATQRQRRE